MVIIIFTIIMIILIFMIIQIITIYIITMESWKFEIKILVLMDFDLFDLN